MQPAVEPASSSPSPSTSDFEILVVDDEAALCSAVGAALEARGYRTRMVRSGREALAATSLHEPDIVLLDLGLPDIDGIEVCRHLRRWYRSPIIVLTADGSERRKVRALEEGADDYVTKPFSMPELLARVTVATRHRRVLAAVVDDVCIDVGSLRVDTASHEAWVEGARLDLTPKEFALLTMLARNAGRVLTHRTLLGEVWGEPQGANTQPLRTAITTLRKKLGTGGRRPLLVTEAGVGYRLLEPDEGS
jgi:two-component system, OmpR family, KDP operon response regulator KdpE